MLVLENLSKLKKKNEQSWSYKLIERHFIYDKLVISFKIRWTIVVH